LHCRLCDDIRLPRRPGLGDGARLSPGGAPTAVRPRPCLHGVHSPDADLGGFFQVPAARETFRRFRTAGVGEKMILEDNIFVERLLPGSVMRKLGDDEMAQYRAPFPTPESRRPIWRFPNELPIEGQPADVHATLEAAHAALATSRYPKLLFAASPGALVSPALAHSFAAELENCRLVSLGSGAHYLQE